MQPADSEVILSIARGEGPPFIRGSRSPSPVAITGSKSRRNASPSPVRAAGDARQRRGNVVLDEISTPDDAGEGNNRLSALTSNRVRSATPRGRRSEKFGSRLKASSPSPLSIEVPDIKSEVTANVGDGDSPSTRPTPTAGKARSTTPRGSKSETVASRFKSPSPEPSFCPSDVPGVSQD